MSSKLENSLLGKIVKYKNDYDNGLLFRIPRIDKRKELGWGEKVPFYGLDIWNAYEVSWLNEQGKPLVYLVRMYVPANSEFIAESKSLKLYFNSLNNSRFSSISAVFDIIKKDLETLVNTSIELELIDVNSHKETIGNLSGENIDSLDIKCLEYDTANPELLEYENVIVTEEINSNLLKSNCLVTNQPDWGSVVIKYTGKKIQRESLLQYIVSFRNHNEFHEQCVERIFRDISKLIDPTYLSVYASYTRRGGVDISPYRTTEKNFVYPKNIRLVRQ